MIHRRKSVGKLCAIPSSHARIAKTEELFLQPEWKRVVNNSLLTRQRLYLFECLQRQTGGVSGRLPSKELDNPRSRRAVLPRERATRLDSS